MNSGMFRGKESSNRIELSRLVQDLLNFGVLGSLQLWGWGGGWGAPHTRAHAHARVLNMIISCKWPPPLGESLGIPYDVIHACACMCVHACMHVHVHMCGGHPLTIPHPPGGTPGISQNSIALELIEIFQFHGDCGDFPTHGWVYGLVGGLMGGIRSKH